MNFKKRVNGSWVDAPNYIHNTSTDTITTLPAVVYPNGTTATVGLKGQAVQNGTPTPDNPIMPEGTGERTGNLAKYWKPAYVTANGSVNANRVNGLSFPVKLEAGQTISFTNQKANFGRGIAVFSGFDGEILTDMIYRSTNNNVTYTADSDCYVVIWGNYDNTTSMDETMFNLCGQMLNLGSTALPYEPFGVKIPILSAGQTTPVYLGEVETTRKIKKLVLTGQETGWQGAEAWGGRNRFVLSVSDAITADTSNPYSICSHLPLGASGATYGRDNVYTIASGKLYMRLTIDYDKLTTFKAYLQQQYAAGTPVTVWYVLATEETAVVNEPLMKIGDYADTLSNMSIPVTAGGDTLSVGTTVQPSEVTAAYHGWHTGTVHERESGSWTE